MPAFSAISHVLCTVPHLKVYFCEKEQYNITMTLSEELQWRGFINQTTFDDLHELDERVWTFYNGFDASADSQTVGNLAPMMLDRIFMRHGHKAIILAGGATSLIGDPGGKDAERPLQDEATIEHNVARAEAQLKKICQGYDFTLVNNLDWTKQMTVIEFLRDIGKHFSMTPLVQRDYIARRLGEGGAGISYAEFSYTILQGMDFLHLYDTYGCTLQLGGSDQWGNCLSGVDLIRRARGVEAHVITLPLIINKATGKKFGKSEAGAVWLDPERTSPYKFYQFWLNTDDEGVEDYLKIFTELDKEAVDTIMTEFHANPSGRNAQKVLAYEVTKIVHGTAKTEAVRKVTEVLFGEGNFQALDEADLAILHAELPVVEAPADSQLPGILVQAGLAPSRSEATRLIAGGAVSVNGVKAAAGQMPTLRKGSNLVRRGKNSFAIVSV
jgi:tyrosyl-tRNA synthetase